MNKAAQLLDFMIEIERSIFCV